MAKSYTVIISAEAEMNIEQAFHWIAKNDIETAERWYDGLISGLKSLSKFPLRCPISPEARLGLVDSKIRQYLYGRGCWKYRVLYVIEGDRVLIAHIRHSARRYWREDEQT